MNHTEQRLTDIELKLTAMEDLVETLNNTVYRQQTSIERLQDLCTTLARRIHDMDNNAGGQAPDEKPPHY